MTARDLLLECFRAALDAVDARRCVRESLARRPLPAGDWHVVGIGKAAGAMAQGAVEALGPSLAGGIVVVPPGHLPPGFDPATHGLEVYLGAHPVPDELSLAAGESVLDFVASRPPDAQLLYLISGGASSLAEALRPGVTLEDLQRLNQWALGSGLPIQGVNSLRRRLSRLKGGGLARLSGRRRACALLVSDVPGDDPGILGSGLLHGATTTVAGPDGPPWMRELLARMIDTESTLPAVPRIPTRLVATLGIACDAAARAASTQGLTVVRSPRRLAGDAAALGSRLVARLQGHADGTVYVRGGESTVSLPIAPGRGGRNQHLALAAAIAMEGARRPGPVLLAAGTDGIDGVTADAGAIVDAETCGRGRDAGFDPHVSLAGADSGSFLEASGDLLHTGPTLTNVGDLVLALRWGGER